MMRTLLAAVAAIVIAGCGEVTSVPDATPSTADGPVGSADAPVAVDAPPSSPDASWPDAMPDATPPTAPFDIAIANKWTITNTTGVGASWTGLIVNMSTTNQSMDLNDLEVVSFQDDHPTIAFSFAMYNPATYTLPAGQAGGMMSSGAAAIVDPLVSEPRFNTQRPTFDFGLNSIPQPIDITVHASAVVRHGNQYVTLPFTFVIKSSGTVGATITGAGRYSSSPM